MPPTSDQHCFADALVDQSRGAEQRDPRGGVETLEVELVEAGAVEAARFTGSHRDERADRLGVEPAEREDERGGRRGIDPLRVVDQQEQRRSFGRTREQLEERGTDGDRVRGRLGRRERALQGSGGGGIELRREHREGEHQRREGRERDTRFDLGADDAGDGRAAGRLGGGREEGRLADARVAAEQERAGSP